jgi:hypothetical protein
MGLGIKHIHTVQEITRLKEILTHSMQNSLLGSLYKTSLSCLILELGLETPLHNIPYKTLNHVATPSLMKTTWEFLNLYGIELKNDLPMPPPRQGNASLT